MTMPETHGAAAETLHTLMVRYVDGDRRAFDRLARHIEPRLRTFFRRRVASPEVIDDLVQQTFLRVHTSRRHYDDRWNATPSAVQAWFLTTARRTMIDYFRSEYRRQARLDTVRQRDDVEAYGGRAAPSTPEEHLGEEERRAQVQASVRQAIGALPLHSREVVRRHKLEGESMPHIARDLGIATVSLRVRAHRAYRKLATALAPLKSRLRAP